MPQSKQIENMIELLTNELASNQKTQPSNAGNDKKNRKNRLSPAQILVLIGILSGSLQVDSVSIDKDQTVKILLAGSLKRKTELEKMIDEIGEMPFEEVFKAMMDRLG